MVRLRLRHCYDDRLAVEQHDLGINTDASLGACTESLRLLIGSWEGEPDLTFACLSPAEAKVIVCVNRYRLFNQYCTFECTYLF